MPKENRPVNQTSAMATTHKRHSRVELFRNLAIKLPVIVNGRASHHALMGSCIPQYLTVRILMGPNNYSGYSKMVPQPLT